MDLKIRTGFNLNEDYEIVERKGVGHPDTLCDAIAERCSFEYSQYFLKKYGKIAHHWFDKVILVGGRSDITYGVGEIIDPYKIIICGKCVKRIDNIEVPLYKIFQKAVSYVLSDVLSEFDESRHLIIIDETVDSHGAGRKSSRYQPNSIDDLELISRKNRVSNDCNILSAHYPYSTLEKTVLTIENYLNSKQYKKKTPYCGADIKITAIKNENTFEFVINVPILAKYVRDENDYTEKVNSVKKDIQELLRKELQELNIKLNVNPQDKTGYPYITAIGSAADTGDVGVVGRGNRSNGLITPMKSMSIEAAPGKNPLDHTGKIYTQLCNRLSKELYDSMGIPNQVHITTYKELKINDPQNIILEFSRDLKESEKKAVEKLVNTYTKESKINEIISDMINNFTVMW